MENVNMNLVSHPKHYCHSDRKECWEEMRDIFGDSAVAIFDILSAYKYLYRAGTKDGNPEEQDIAKIIAYVQHCQMLLDRNQLEKMMDAHTAFAAFNNVRKYGYNPFQE